MSYVKPIGSFGKWLKDKMEEHDLTEQELANIIGINRATVNYHVRGRIIPHLRTVQAYSRYFCVPWQDIYDMVLRDRTA